MFPGQPIRILLIFATLGTGTLFAQSCPSSDAKDIDAPQASVLHGTIKFHPGTRPWLGLVLPKPACGASEIELAFKDGEFRAKQMDHCSVTVKGVISASPTIYYSTDLNIFDPVITPDPACKLLPPDPDYTKSPSPIRSRPTKRQYLLTFVGTSRCAGKSRRQVVDWNRGNLTFSTFLTEKRISD